MSTKLLCTTVAPLAKRNVFSLLAGFLHLRCQSSGAQCTPGQWQLVSAVCLQRMPVITAEKTRLEQQYANMMAQMELESSLLSDHELHAIEDKIVAEKQKEEDDLGDKEIEGSRLTAFDLEDAWESEAKLFTPAGRITEADEKNDLKSVDRKLDQKLLLLVKQTLGDKAHWVFPQGPRLEGESMRQAAEHTLQKLCGDNISAQFLGNAPCGFYQYRFPPAAKIGTGAKVFFFKAWYKDGAVTLDNSNTTDHLWVTADELSKFCSHSYLKSIKKFLLDL